MKIKIAPPPNIEDIRKVFPDLQKGTVFTYGDTIYAPDIYSEAQIESHIHVHEDVHARQQQNPEEWWAKYLSDPNFRLSQELEAYGEQFRYVQSLSILAKT